MIGQNKLSHNTFSKKKVILIKHVVLMSIIAHMILTFLALLDGEVKLSMIITVFASTLTLTYLLPFKWCISFNRYYLIIGPSLIPVFELTTSANHSIFLGFIYAPIYILIVILLLFSSYYERIKLWTLVCLSFLYTLFYDRFLMSIASTPDIQFILDEYILYKAPIVLVWVLILVCFGYYMNFNDKAYKKIQSLNAELLATNREIENKNNILKELLTSRTEKLVLHNRKLISYGEIISHEVRAPLARLVGLKYLMQAKTGSDINEYRKIISMFEHEIDELHKVITKAGNEINLNIEFENLVEDYLEELPIDIPKN